MHLDVQYHETKCIINEDGFIPPFDELGNPIPPSSRLERLVLYHGAKSEKSRNDILAQFPPELISQLTNVKELTILSFIDEEISSRKLVQSMHSVESLKFRFMND